MEEEQKKQILTAAKNWFRDVIVANHAKNTEKLVNAKKFNVNPFIVKYVANFLTGNSSPASIAKAMVYPRALGTSITTSFGQNMQKFTEVLNSIGSTTNGIDIEFIDALDGDRKYCQLKAGPDTINFDDITTIHNHFVSIKNLSRTNNLKLNDQQLIVGVMYGEPSQLNSRYKDLRDRYHYPVICGQEFWLRLTGDEGFYDDLINTIGEVAVEANYAERLDEIIAELSDSDLVQSLSDK